MEEKSFGIIPLRKKEGKWEAFLVKLKSGNHWSFPKGHPEKKEEEGIFVAIRELKEETNLSIKRYLFSHPFVEHYFYKKQGEKIKKTVTYFAAEVKGQVHLQKKEILEGKWIQLKDAPAIITHKESQALCSLIESLL